MNSPHMVHTHPFLIGSHCQSHSQPSGLPPGKGSRFILPLGVYVCVVVTPPRMYDAEVLMQATWGTDTEAVAAVEVIPRLVEFIEATGACAMLPPAEPKECICEELVV